MSLVPLLVEGLIFVREYVPNCRFCKLVSRLPLLGGGGGDELSVLLGKVGSGVAGNVLTVADITLVFGDEGEEEGVKAAFFSS
jgi:hypothetical protein